MMDDGRWTMADGQQQAIANSQLVHNSWESSRFFLLLLELYTITTGYIPCATNYTNHKSPELTLTQAKYTGVCSLSAS
jgi:hypothetical protein